ncbi:MAG: hypothetical protein WBG23_02120 [Acidobacteriaceae bacterium]
MSDNAPENPLTQLLKGPLSKYDFGVLEHGFAAHGRDYRFLIQDSLCKDPATYELIFTHVVDFKYETRVGEKIWVMSWGDEYTDFSRWEASGEPEGYVFGARWSLAYPGFSILPASPDAMRWSELLNRPMYSASLETDLFCISLVFSEARHRKLPGEIGTVQKVVIPLPDPKKLQ